MGAFLLPWAPRVARVSVPRAGGLGAAAVTASWRLSQLLARANNTLFNPGRAAFPNLPAEIHEP